MKWLLKKDEYEDSWLGLDALDFAEIKDNPFLERLDNELYNKYHGLFETEIMRRPEYLSYAIWLLTGIKLAPFQQVVFYNLWTHSFPMFIATRGGGKTFLMGLYSLMRAIMFPEYKVVLAGSSFRQSRMIFDYAENIWNESPVLRSLCSSKSRPTKNIDRWDFKINNSFITAIPIGPTGEKVRGLRAHTVVVDEFASHNPQIAEEVLFGFGAVNSAPVEKYIEVAKKRKMEEHGFDIDSFINSGHSNRFGYNNQSIITGTAHFYFNHFYEYWQRYKKIVESRGQKEKLDEIFPGGIPPAFDWRDYCVIRMPYSSMPPGFMDDKVIARAKSQMSSALYNKEYEAVFVEDSDGFFRRSLIERCVANDKNIGLNNWCTDWCPAPFSAVTRGQAEGSYIYGIDPASENDNLSIVILENHEEHSRVVYCWSINKDGFHARRRAGFTAIDDYYQFVVRKIRDLMKVFPCESIGIDTQGGGYALIEALHNKSYLQEGEHQLWVKIDKDKKRDSDDRPGLHILEEIQFANYSWLRDANYDLRKDMETRSVLFPEFDPVTIELSIVQDKMRMSEIKQKMGKEITLFDSLEDCVEEIEELKDELTSIIVTTTGGGINAREKWIVPEIKTSNNKKTSGKKDRYSSLLIANSIARKLRYNKIYKKEYDVSGGGFLSDYQTAKNKREPLYEGPSWFVEKMQ